MEDYNKIIESLGVRFLKANNIKVIQPITVENFYDVENTILYVNQGQISFEENDETQVVSEGQILFIPGGKQVRITYGRNAETTLTNEDLINNRENYFSTYDINDGSGNYDSYSYVNFDAKVFDSVNFFASLDIPPFIIANDERVNHLIRNIIFEVNNNEPGKNRIIKLTTDHMICEIIRHILRNNLFVEQLATNSTYFKDPRLIDIFNYIKENLGGDLSNKVLAGVANVSEDYVGQYFKMLTGINPQDYIEYQRMEQAVNLLRTTKKSIRDIGKEVGYKDTAYFCRRFKMMFGIPAGKMRRRESLMNV